MAAGGPASELIMFMVAVLVAGSVAGALAYVTTDIANGMNDRGAMLADQLRTDFAIINDPTNIPVAGTGPYTYTFYIKNIGKTSIPFTSDAIQVFINGEIVPPANLAFTDVNGNSITSLPPYEVGVIVVTRETALTPGNYYKLTVVLENGKKRSLVFKAPSP
ncbi:archaeal flagella-related protein G [Thermococcus kodakarensis KOD1]|uniref:Archaeal flagella-related protein G n=1 Tax=Thermococcus kodakarensis (strain ATCC BAA-918 / JCM 12380 / KOD1) TaxID=69014 RepID=Q5JEE6_THEKO|nr:flagellar protein G [Thermococcus kodakarensis]WCN28163.1 flagellar protein G [Thermococcus kodakarensis]WCN30461.1 flagellar protein G [Thermococcus kodakarensis]BAD84235.1 archaeal flagella-related protein G [Thermococcus kodakarensis KOD1]